MSGKLNLGRMLRETRDLRQFPMTPEQYRRFRKLARKQRLLFSAIRDRDGRGSFIDVILPVTELDRANQVFERMLYRGTAERYAPEREQGRERTPATDEKERQELETAERGPMRDRQARGEEAPPKKECRSERGLPGTKASSSIPRGSGSTDRTTSERPSVEDRLKAYRSRLEKRPAPAREKVKNRPKMR